MEKCEYFKEKNPFTTPPFLKPQQIDKMYKKNKGQMLLEDDSLYKMQFI